MNLQADIGDHALAQPTHEIEPERRSDREHGHDQQQIAKPARDIAGVAARCKAPIDHQFEASGNGERR